MGRVIALAASALLLASCGGEDESSRGKTNRLSPTTTQQAEVPGWVASRLAEIPGDDVALIFGTSDHAVGSVRIVFAVVRDDGGLVRRKRSSLLVVREGAQKGLKTDARLVSLGAGARSEDEPHLTQLYVAQAPLSEPGRYWLLAEPAGARIQGFGSIYVRSKSQSPAVGSKAVSSRNPTLRDAPASRITTATPPDTELLRHSIADSLEARKPFVVAFATPAFCQSRTCGPTVEVVDAVRERFAGRGIRFIHVEIYEDNNPAKGLNRWVREWNLPTEPWVFVVDRSGTIRAKFEGSVSIGELDRAVRAHLL